MATRGEHLVRADRRFATGAGLVGRLAAPGFKRVLDLIHERLDRGGGINATLPDGSRIQRITSRRAQQSDCEEIARQRAELVSVGRRVATGQPDRRHGIHSVTSFTVNVGRWRRHGSESRDVSPHFVRLAGTHRLCALLTIAIAALRLAVRERVAGA